MSAERLTPQEVIRAVVAADARLPLAAERLGLSRSEIISIITSEQSSLAEQLRTAFILQLYNTMMETQLVFQMNLEKMSPGDVSRAYAQQVAGFASLTARPSEDASEQPVDIQMARNNLNSRLDEYQRRKNEPNTRQEEETG